MSEKGRVGKAKLNWWGEGSKWETTEKNPKNCVNTQTQREKVTSSTPPFASSNEEQIWTCLYRKQREEEINKEREGGGTGKQMGRKRKEKGKGKRKGKERKQPSSHLSSFHFSSPKQLD